MRSVTSKTEYATLAILELAKAQSKNELASAQEIADKYGLSSPFMGNVLQILKRASLVETERGAHGGFRLIPKPDEITLGYVAALIETEERKNRPNRSEELATRSRSPRKDAASQTRDKLHEIWQNAEIKRQEYLNSILFSDLLERNEVEQTFNYTI